MDILDSNETPKEKYTILAKPTNEYPQPGSIVLVHTENLKDIIEAANSVLGENGGFLQSSITQTSQTNLQNKTIFAPCLEEQNADHEFPILLKVEKLIPGRVPKVITNSPFMNLPDSIKMEFDADDLTVVKLCFGADEPIKNKDQSKDVSLYYDKNGNEVAYEIIDEMPAKLAEWVYSNCVKVFARVFDFTGELQSSYEKFYGAKPIVKHTDSSKLDERHGHSSTVKVIDHKKYSSKSSKLIDNDLTEHMSDDEVIDLVETHPLYDYTCEVASNVFIEIESICGVQLSEEKLALVMKKLLADMLQAKISIQPNK